MRQTKRMQCRAYNGTPVGDNDETEMEEIEPAAFSGKVHNITAGARSDNWV